MIPIKTLWTGLKQGIFVVVLGYMVILQFMVWKGCGQNPSRTLQNAPETTILQPVVPRTILGTPKEVEKREECVPVIHYVPVKEALTGAASSPVEGTLKLGTFQVEKPDYRLKIEPLLNPTTGRTTLLTEEERRFLRWGGQTLLGGSVTQDSLFGRQLSVTFRQELARIGPAHLEFEGEYAFLDRSSVHTAAQLNLPSSNWRLKINALFELGKR